MSPTFNEAESLPLLIQAVSEALDGIEHELVIVDDDSPDGTWARAQEIAAKNPRVRVIRRRAEPGLGHSVIDGFRSAQAKIVACMDADLQHDPKILPRMLEEVERGADLVVGSRYIDGGGTGDWNRFRAFQSWVATKLAHWILGVRLKDPMSGYFCMRRSQFEQVSGELDGEGFKILLEVVAKVRPRKVVEVPYEFRARVAGDSKLTSRVALLYLRQLVRLFLFRRPLPIRFAKFGIVGSVGTVVNLATLGILVQAAGIADWRASVLAGLAGMMHNYTVNNRWTFRDRRRRGLRAFWQGFGSYVSMSLVGMVVTTVVYVLLSTALSHWLYSGEAAPALLLMGCQLLGIGSGTYFNYRLNKRVTWRRAPVGGLVKNSLQGGTELPGGGWRRWMAAGVGAATGSMRALANSRAAHVVFLVVTFGLYYGRPVPALGEFYYLLRALKVWDADFLAHDWAFSQPAYTHYFFELAIAPLFAVLPLEVLGWLGRLTCWTLVFYALLRLAGQIRVPLWAASLGIVCWFASGQSQVASEWVLGNFEAKTVAYALLLLALGDFVEKKDVRGAILLGAVHTLHPGLGIYAIPAGFLALVATHGEWRRMIRAAVWTGLAALPGLVLAVLSLSLGSSTSPDDWRFNVEQHMWFHADPSTFGLRGILLTLTMFGFTWSYARKQAGSPALRLVAWFLAGAMLFFAGGLVFGAAERPELLRLLPFRLAAVLVPLFFAFSIAHLLVHHTSLRLGRVTLASALIAAALIADLPPRLRDGALAGYHDWTVQDDLRECFHWIRENTPESALVIAPPWRDDSYYYSRRAQIVSLKAVPFERYGEWRQRLEDLVGPLRPEGDLWGEVLQSAYNSITAERLVEISQQYGAEFLISAAEYDLPILHATETYFIYSLACVQTAEAETEAVDVLERCAGASQDGSET